MLRDQSLAPPPEDAIAIDIVTDDSEPAAMRPPHGQHSSTRARGDGGTHHNETNFEVHRQSHTHGHSHGHDEGEETRVTTSGPEYRRSNGHSHSHSQSSMNMRALLLHVLGDALGNVGVIASGLIIWLTTWPGKYYSDPIISLVITVIIFTSALPLGEYCLTCDVLLADVVLQ